MAENLEWWTLDDFVKGVRTRVQNIVKSGLSNRPEENRSLVVGGSPVENNPVRYYISKGTDLPDNGQNQPKPKKTKISAAEFNKLFPSTVKEHVASHTEQPKQPKPSPVPVVQPNKPLGLPPTPNFPPGKNELPHEVQDITLEHLNDRLLRVPHVRLEQFNTLSPEDKKRHIVENDPFKHLTDKERNALFSRLKKEIHPRFSAIALRKLGLGDLLGDFGFDPEAHIDDFTRLIMGEMRPHVEQGRNKKYYYHRGLDFGDFKGLSREAKSRVQNWAERYLLERAGYGAFTGHESIKREVKLIKERNNKIKQLDALKSKIEEGGAFDIGAITSYGQLKDVLSKQGLNLKAVTDPKGVTTFPVYGEDSKEPLATATSLTALKDKLTQQGIIKQEASNKTVYQKFEDLEAQRNHNNNSLDSLYRRRDQLKQEKLRLEDSEHQHYTAAINIEQSILDNVDEIKELPGQAGETFMKAVAVISDSILSLREENYGDARKNLNKAASTVSLLVNSVGDKEKHKKLVKLQALLYSLADEAFYIQEKQNPVLFEDHKARVESELDELDEKITPKETEIKQIDANINSLEHSNPTLGKYKKLVRQLRDLDEKLNEQREQTKSLKKKYLSIDAAKEDEEGNATNMELAANPQEFSFEEDAQPESSEYEPESEFSAFGAKQLEVPEKYYVPDYVKTGDVTNPEEETAENSTFGNLPTLIHDPEYGLWRRATDELVNRLYPYRSESELKTALEEKGYKLEHKGEEYIATPSGEDQQPIKASNLEQLESELVTNDILKEHKTYFLNYVEDFLKKYPPDSNLVPDVYWNPETGERMGALVDKGRWKKIHDLPSDVVAKYAIIFSDYNPNAHSYEELWEAFEKKQKKENPEVDDVDYDDLLTAIEHTTSNRTDQETGQKIKFPVKKVLDWQYYQMLRALGDAMVESLPGPEKALFEQVKKFNQHFSGKEAHRSHAGVLRRRGERRADILATRYHGKMPDWVRLKNSTDETTHMERAGMIPAIYEVNPEKIDWNQKFYGDTKPKKEENNQDTEKTEKSLLIYTESPVLYDYVIGLNAKK